MVGWLGWHRDQASLMDEEYALIWIKGNNEAANLRLDNVSAKGDCVASKAC